MIYRMKDAAKCDWRNPVFRVYRKGKLLQVGTAKELQLLFNKRHRQLKQELIQQVKMDDICRAPAGALQISRRTGLRVSSK